MKVIVVIKAVLDSEEIGGLDSLAEDMSAGRVSVLDLCDIVAQEPSAVVSLYKGDLGQQKLLAKIANT